MYPCDGGECASVQSMCHGEALCQDKSDLKECNSDLVCYDTIDDASKHSIDFGRTECDYEFLRNDER